MSEVSLVAILAFSSIKKRNPTLCLSFKFIGFGVSSLFAQLEDLSSFA